MMVEEMIRSLRTETDWYRVGNEGWFRSVYGKSPRYLTKSRFVLVLEIRKGHEKISHSTGFYSLTGQDLQRSLLWDHAVLTSEGMTSKLLEQMKEMVFLSRLHN